MSNLFECNMDNEKKSFIVVIFTAIVMVVEIIYGYITNSMALLADGLHMSTHALALTLTCITYILIKKFKDSELFPNGTEKINSLSAYTSSLFLGITGIFIIYEAIERLINPLKIKFDDAIFVAIIGLTVNIICILIMGEHNHQHLNKHCHKNEELHNISHKEDFNFKAAYLHILADILTSILAIIALIAGKYFDLVFLDSIIGILGGIIILKWTINLLKKTVKDLIDMKIN